MRQNRTNLVLGMLLILIGGWLVISRQVPAVQDWLDTSFTWPMYTIGAELIVFLIGFITGAPGMSIPASILTGIGGREGRHEQHQRMVRSASRETRYGRPVSRSRS